MDEWATVKPGGRNKTAAAGNSTNWLLRSSSSSSSSTSSSNLCEFAVRRSRARARALIVNSSVCTRACRASDHAQRVICRPSITHATAKSRPQLTDVFYERINESARRWVGGGRGTCRSRRDRYLCCRIAACSTRNIGRVSYIRIYLCYLCFRWKTVCLVQASMQHLLHHDTVSLQQSKITLQNNCINDTSITQPTLSF